MISNIQKRWFARTWISSTVVGLNHEAITFLLDYTPASSTLRGNFSVLRHLLDLWYCKYLRLVVNQPSLALHKSLCLVRTSCRGGNGKTELDIQIKFRRFATASGIFRHYMETSLVSEPGKLHWEVALFMRREHGREHMLGLCCCGLYLLLVGVIGSTLEASNSGKS